MAKTTINELAKLLASDDTKGDSSQWGVVQSLITDGEGTVTGYNVSLGGSSGTIETTKGCGATVGDTVLLNIRSNGEVVPIITKGGDADAAAAQSTANGVSTNLANNYYNKTTVDQKIAQAGGQAVYSATCSTAASTQAKVASCDDFTLKEGAIVNVAFTYANTVANPTLNVNNTGAKAIQLNGAAISSLYYWKAGSAVQFYYNGTAWQMLVAAYFSDLMALAATIGGWDISAAGIYKGCTSLTDTNYGTFLGAKTSSSSGGVRNVGAYGTTTLANGKLELDINQGVTHAGISAKGSDGTYTYQGNLASKLISLYQTSDSTVRRSVDIKPDGIALYSGSGFTAPTITINSKNVLTYTDLSVTVATATRTESFEDREQIDGTISVTNTGYYPIGVVGVNCDRYHMAVNAYLQTRNVGSATVAYNGSANGYVSASGTIAVHILWAKV